MLMLMQKRCQERLFTLAWEREGLPLELHRVLKSGGSIYTTSEHLETGEFMDIMGKGGLFSLVGEREGVFEFERVQGG